MRVIVIGGGIGGLTAAIALRQVGIEVDVYERAPVLREVGAGIGLMSNAMRALDILGMGDEVRSQSLARNQLSLRHANGRVISVIPDMRTFFVMHRAELLALLVRSMEPERLHMGWACTGFEQDADGVTASFENGSTVRADVLIGADGLRSVVKSRLLEGGPVKYSGYTCWRAIVAFQNSGEISPQESWGAGQRFGIMPMSGGRVYWFATKNAAEGGRDASGQVKKGLARLFRGWHDPVEALLEGSAEESILRNDIYDFDPLPNFVRGRVALLGDAAHGMTPNLGQGACQAMEDGVLLGACLTKNASLSAGLLEYEHRRMPRTRQVVLRARWAGVMAQWENPVVRWMRDTAMRAIPQKFNSREMNLLQDVELLSPAERALFPSAGRL